MARLQSRQFAFLMFFCLGTIWGTNFLFMKMALAVIDPLQVVWLRVLFGSVPILIFAWGRGALSLKDAKHSRHFLAMALLANVLPYYFFVKGTHYLPSGIAGVFSGTIPLMTAFLVTLLLPSEKLTNRKIIGLLVGLVGVVLLAHLQSAFSRNMDTELLGSLFMLLGALCYAAAMVYAKKFIGPLGLSSLKLASYQMLISSIILAVISPKAGITDIFNHPLSLWALILGLGLLGTGFAFVMYYFIIEKLGAVTASSVYYIPPVVALIFGLIFLNEVVTASQILGTLAIIAGIYLAKEKAPAVKINGQGA